MSYSDDHSGSREEQAEPGWFRRGARLRSGRLRLPRRLSVWSVGRSGRRQERADLEVRPENYIVSDISWHLWKKSEPDHLRRPLFTSSPYRKPLATNARLHMLTLSHTSTCFSSSVPPPRVSQDILRGWSVTSVICFHILNPPNSHTDPEEEWRRSRY